MIETLGQSAINSAITAGRSEFMSIFRKAPSHAYSSDRYPRPYSSTRGIIIDKRFVEGVSTPDLSNGYRFQFNPQTISDVKETLYELCSYAGLPYNDYIWGGGGERIISFQLFLDNTPQSKQSSFRPTSYGSKLAKQFQTEGNDYSSNKNRNFFGRDTVADIKSQGRTIKENIFPSSGPDSFKFTDTGAYSLSRVDARGILPEVELIQSFLYPAPLDNEKTPKFAEGGMVSKRQFRPPATVILAIGPLYLEGVIKSAPVSYTLFDKDLTPLRGTIDIEFGVFEFMEVKVMDL